METEKLFPAKEKNQALNLTELLTFIYLESCDIGVFTGQSLPEFKVLCESGGEAVLQKIFKKYKYSGKTITIKYVKSN